MLPALAGAARLLTGSGAGRWVMGQSGHARITMSWLGAEKLPEMLTRFHVEIDDFTRFWQEDVAPLYFNDVQRNIMGQGHAVGGWRALSPRYAAWKRAQVGHSEIMLLTSRLARSLMPGAAESVVVASRRQALLGSKVPYLKYHQTGTRRMPQRRVLVPIEAGDRRYGALLRDFVARTAERSNFPNVRPKPRAR